MRAHRSRDSLRCHPGGGGRWRRVVPTGAPIQWIAILLGIMLIGGLIGLSGASPVIGSPMVDDDAPSHIWVEDVNVSGDGFIEKQYDIVQNHPGSPFVWQNEPLDVSVEIRWFLDSDPFEFCTTIFDDDGEEFSRECHDIDTANGTNATFTYEFEEWPGESDHDRYSFRFDLIQEDDRAVMLATYSVNVITKDGDLTGDGLTNEEEVTIGTDFTRPDTSGNGLTDWEEVRIYGTDPLKLDTTGDGIDDATLIRFGLDPTERYALHTRILKGFLAAFVLIGFVIEVRRRGIISKVVSGPGTNRSMTSVAQSAGTGETQSTGVADNEADESAESLLTDEEIVRELLAEHDGRMKQKTIVDLTGWSKAKTSRCLSRLEEDGSIQKLRLGRENLISLADDQDGITQDAE